MEDPPESFEEFTPRAVSSLAQGENENIEPTLTALQTGPEEPEKPIGPAQNIDRVISETEDIVSRQLNITIDQRRFTRLLHYKIEALQNLITEHLQPHLDKINTFLVRNHELQERWMRCYLKVLPSYGDYAAVLEYSSNLVDVQGIPRPVRESSLKSLAEEVTSGLYASAQQVRVMRVNINEEIYNSLDKCREVCEEKYLPYKQWLELCKLQLDRLDQIQTACFQDVSNIDFNGLGGSPPS